MTDRRNYSYYTDGSAARKIEKRPETHAGSDAGSQ